MEGGYGGFVTVGKDDPISEVGGSRGQGAGLEGLTNGSRLRGGRKDGVR